ncbi:alpha-glucosidase/alpha-galactosidase [Sansalvadorimonas sp. 2012CJ34-2]|uniref:Alpha-glucosidase/alpha-galactosidase n=1 Tax=Parendozoicomonas callyspongiae TaxID=2942213 RepID=A0ABT0PGK7_9GAMM|nr:alpha-glucosidase/alpha-galactosidase [Sansalvadorimonas sp. 2012CJ34-2]MCL6270504.1 alpha-glucosidase/alpha-galactosidase [Sansalvadorimonas sp. 2012CJ34-2]
MGFKVAIIGAGSTVFMRNIVRDILHKPALQNAEIALQDIDSKRLAESHLVAAKLVDAMGVEATVVSTENRRAALEGADVVMTSFQIGGYKPCTVTDFDIPKKYGLQQTIADTLGIGGIMRGLRTVPVMLDIANDIRELCPNALLMNYVNPMAIISGAMHRLAPDINYVGLCHSVQGTAEHLAEDLGEEIKDIVYTCGGINHMAFYKTFEKVHADGHREDLYPRLKSLFAEGKAPKDNLVRYKIMEQFGYFVTESSEHFAEYSPWFIKEGRQDLIEQYNIPIDEYIRRCEVQISEWDEELKKLHDGGSMNLKESHEYAATIVNSLATGEPSVIYGNVANHGLIDNLPQDISVEVACMIDRNGVQPIAFGSLEPQLAALIQTNVNVQQLTVEALATENVEHIYHAAFMDPHTAAELDLDQIRNMVDDLRRAHGDWLPEFARLK